MNTIGSSKAAKDEDFKHLQACREKICTQCDYGAGKHKWKRKLPLLTKKMNIQQCLVDPSNRHRLTKSWLGSKVVDGKFKVICQACDEVKGQDGINSSLNLSNLTKHHNSRIHEANVKVFLGFSLGPRGRPIGLAPTEEKYRLVWDAAQKGPLTKGVAGVGSGEKCEKMRGTLSEALSIVDRKFARKARAMSLERDATDGTLLGRTIMATPDLQRRSFIFGLSKGYGSTSDDITKATVNQFELFSTKNRFLLPRDRKTPIEVKPSPNLEAHTRGILKHVAVDSASDELLSCAIMRGMTDVFRDIETIARDKPHGNRRILSRPWKADEYQENLHVKLFESKHSITQRIEHSHIFKDIFEQECGKQEQKLKTAVRNLRAAKHRFESYSKPRGRFTLWRDAFISTAEHIAVTRTGTVESKDAKDFLDYLDEEVVIQTAMNADAGDETMALLRFSEPEDYDKSIAPDQVSRFLEAAIALFEHGKVTSITGYTQFALEQLKTPRIIITNSASVKEIGGNKVLVSTTIRKCLQRMCCWVKLAICVVETEWPDWEVLSAFGCLKLAKDERGGDPVIDIKDVRRLATVFKLDAMKLKSEIEAFRPYAQRSFSQSNSSTFEAWAKVLRKVGKKSTDSWQSLSETLQRYAVDTGTTSPCEQTFSKRLQLLNCRFSMSERQDLGILKVALERRPEEEDYVIGLARELWTEHYGEQREMREEKRIDHGIKRKKVIADTETDFLRKRRAATTEAVKACKAEGGMKDVEDVKDNTPEGWTAKHEKEKTFQENKRQKIKAEAFSAGHLLDDEIDDGVKNTAAELEGKSKQNKTKRDSKIRHDERYLGGKKFDLKDFHSKNIFVDKDVDSVEVDVAIRKHSLQKTPDRHLAEMLVVKHLAEPGQRNLWAAVIHGSFLITPAALLRDRSQLQM